MIAFVWFTFEGDSACLVESVSSVRRVYGQDVPVCVFDDAKAPVSGDALERVRPTLYERTRFDRGGNLNGGVAIAGMLDCMRRVAEITRADWVSKIDCDTVLIRRWLIDDLRWAYQGTSWGTEQLGAGLNYVLRKDVPGRLLQHIAGRPGLFKGKSPEDNSIALLTAVCCPGGLLIHDSGMGARHRLAAGWMYHQAMPSIPSECTRFSLVTFGSRYSMDDLTVEQQSSQLARDRVAETMSAFNEWLRNNPPD